MKKNFLFLFLLLQMAILSYSQKITLTSTPPPVDGTVCPEMPTTYKVDVPSGFEKCTIQWSATNDEITSSYNTVSVTWHDIPGGEAQLQCKFVGCGNKNDDTTVTWSALILSVKDQAVPTYYNSLNIDFCAKKQPVHIQIPHVYVQGTGGIGEPPLQEVTYTWKLPPGWYHVNGGSGSTAVNFIDIYPNECAMPGNVIVQGSLAGLCSQAGFTAAATISLNGVRPTLIMGPQGGYAGAILGKTDPVTFTATVSPAIQCVNSYTWTYPRGWSYNGNQTYPAVTTGNTITLIPSGTDADAGPVSVAANLSCGNDLTTMPYTVPFYSSAGHRPGHCLYQRKLYRAECGAWSFLCMVVWQYQRTKCSACIGWQFNGYFQRSTWLLRQCACQCKRNFQKQYGNGYQQSVCRHAVCFYHHTYLPFSQSRSKSHQSECRSYLLFPVRSGGGRCFLQLDSSFRLFISQQQRQPGYLHHHDFRQWHLHTLLSGGEYVWSCLYQQPDDKHHRRC